MPLFLLALLSVTVPTAQYKNARAGANTEETVLTPRNVYALDPATGAVRWHRTAHAHMSSIKFVPGATPGPAVRFTMPLVFGVKR